jgi:N-acetylmuramoyl-L-alanine amidase
MVNLFQGGQLHMAIRNPAQSGRLKSAILRGVYDENLKMESDLPPVRPVRILTKRKKRALTGFFFLLAVTLLVNFYLGAWNLRDEPISIAASTVLPTVISPEPGEVGFPIPVVLPAYTSQPQSYILRRSGIESVALNTDKLLDYSLILNNESVRLSSVFGLDVQTIVIDPGHGGRDPGAIGAMGTKEKDIVLDIALGLRDKLEKSGEYKVILTRDSDITMSLAERVEFANSGRTDLFISLHVNALPQRRENLIETYYYGPPSDEETLRIAEQENRGSGLLTKDFENMIKKIGNTFKEQESATLATAIQHSLFTNVKKYDKDIADAGIKIAPFVVLLGVDAPSVLVEISCISKKQEELKLNMPAYRDEITSFLAEGTIHYLARRNLHVLKGEENGQKGRSKSS